MDGLMGRCRVKPIAMPDMITFDMVKAALLALGLDLGNQIEVTIEAGSVTVKASPGAGAGSMTRTYEVGNWPIRYQPKENISG